MATHIFEMPKYGRIAARLLAARLPEGACQKELRAALHLLSLNVDGRLNAAVVALDVGDVFHRVGGVMRNQANVLMTAVALRLEPSDW